MKSTGTYVYCVVAAARRPAVTRTRGVAGTVRLIEQGRAAALRKWLVVSDVPLDRFGEAAINAKLSDLDWVSRAAVAHEAVVESFSSAAAVVPMKLFTIFTDDDRATANFRVQGEVVDAAIKRVRGRIELGVRVTLDGARTQARPPRRASTGAACTSQERNRSTIGRSSSRAMPARSWLICTICFSTVASDATQRSASELPIKGGPLLLDAAFLVPRTGAARFRKVVERRAKELEPDGYRIALTGPWPPYSFVRN